MPANAAYIRLKITFPVILIAVALLHLFFLISNGPGKLELAFFKDEEAPTVLKIRQVKVPKVESALLKTMNKVLNTTPPKKALTSLSDLSVTPRPGSRPEVLPKNKPLNALSLKSKEFQSQSGGLGISSFDHGANKVSDAVVSIEVPEGIEPDELNKYEQVFYSFQKRTALNYANSILKNLNKFNQKYPNYKLDKNAKILMTARMTYDEKGNVKQIKMIRWTHVNEMQNLFEDVVKGIDQLHNPPRDLWEKHGEFSMFFTLEIITG